MSVFGGSAHERWSLFDLVPDAMVVVNARGRILYANVETERVFGYTPAELSGALLETLLPERVRAQHSVHLSNYFLNPATRPMGASVELVGQHKDGREVAVEISLSSVREGDVTVGIAALRDVTARKRAEEAEREGRAETARVQAQLDCAPNAVVRLDRDARITHVNEAWRRFARENNANAETIVGVGLNYLDAARGIREESVRLVAEALPEMLTGLRDTFTAVYPCHSPTQVRWFRLDARRINSDDAVVTIHTDITEHYLAEGRLRVQAVVAQSLAERAPLVESCRRILAATCERLEWDFGAVWQRNETGNLRCAETWTSPACPPASDFERATRAIDIPVGQGLVGQAWTSQVHEWIEEVAADPRFARASAAAEAGLRTAFFVPLCAEGEVLAVLEFFSRIQRSPDQALLDLLATAGAQLGTQVLRVRAERRALGAEAAQLSLRDTLDAIMECAPVFILAIRPSGAIQFINKVLPQYTKEQVIGSNWLQYAPPADHAQSRLRLQRVIATGTIETYEVAIAGPNRETLWFSCHLGPMHQGAQIVGAVLVSQEVTALRRAQTEVAAAQRWAAIGTLAAGVAHEINTPLQFVNDSLQFLRDAARDVFGLVEKLQLVRQLAATPERAAELQAAVAEAIEAEQDSDLAYLHENVPSAFERCTDGLARVTDIVRALKEFAHPAQQQMAPTDLNRAILTTLTIARNEYRYIADLKTDLQELPEVTCHINEINQVVLNLVVNAAHAVEATVLGSDRRGTITVATRHDGEHVFISIGDTGTGISDEVAPRIFDPFFTTKEVGRGTGQGLALAWGVVTEKHGGELRFETELGVGTTFFIQLPVAGRPHITPR